MRGCGDVMLCIVTSRVRYRLVARPGQGSGLDGLVDLSVQ